VGWYIVFLNRAGEEAMRKVHKGSALNRLKTVRGHLDAVIQMVEEERYCPQIMKQISALQASLERVNRILLQNHLETCVPVAIAEGRSEQIVDELMESLKYTAAVTGPAHSLDEVEP
jgi:DNA-binding FrmR family transcriptional regulator